ncbi:hypothetical protein [Vibrio jasicida]|uniref:hypothetical protein n=1 Tax=Vibrio jasicida TaxID=766224 RepID=UPI00390A5D5E
MKIIHIYTQRWRVEDYHKARKTDVVAERQRMIEPEKLGRMAPILAFVAIRLMQLREFLTLAAQLRARGLKDQAEAIESQPCIYVLTQDEWRILYLNANKRGGFYDSKRTSIAN